MESAKIIVRCMLAAVIYGIVHDQITVRVCLEYYTVYHPPLFGTTSPTFIGLAWGVIATWWVGAFLGILIAFSARLGPRKLPAIDVVPLINWLLLAIAAFAIVASFVGYRNGVVPANYRDMIPVDMQRRFAADLWAHNASYISGISGALVLCVIVIIKRLRRPSRATA